MKKAQLLRFKTGVQGTFGLLQSEGFSCGILELPWNNNEKQKSCIPEGLYEVRWTKSPKFGFVYEVTNVPNRSRILIHKGNFAGSVDHGFISNSYGCLLPFIKRGIINRQQAGLMSALAVMDIARFFEQKPFLLEIKNAYYVPGTPQ